MRAHATEPTGKHRDRRGRMCGIPVRLGERARPITPRRERDCVRARTRDLDADAIAHRSRSVQRTSVN